MAAARIAKLKRTSDGRTVVYSIEGKGTAIEKEFTLKSAEEPHPDLLTTLAALERHARLILEWPASYAEGRIKITGVSWSFSEACDVEGAVITGQVMLEEADAPFSFNTPHLPYDQYSDSGAAKLMPTDAQRDLNALKTEVEAFVDGKRAQGDMFAGDAPRPAGKMAAAEQGAANDL